MNCAFFEYLVARHAFDNFPELTQILCDTMLGPGLAETASTRGTVTSEGAVPEVVSMEATTPIPTMLRSPRLKPKPVRETQKPKRRFKWKRSALQRNRPNKNNATLSKATNLLHPKSRRRSSLCRAVAAMSDRVPHFS